MKQYRKIFAYFGSYKKTVLLVLVLTTFQVIGTVLLPFIMSMIIDNGIANQDVSYVLKKGALMVAVTLATCILGMFANRMSGIASAGLGDNLRRAMMEKFCDFSAQDLGEFSKASFINRMTVDVAQVQGIASIFLGTLISAPITIICVFIMSCHINSSLALIFLISVPFFALTAFILLKFAFPYFSKRATSEDDMNRSLLEDLVSIRLVKAFVREKFMTEAYGKEAKKVRDTGCKAEQITNTSNPIENLIVNICIICLLWFGGQKIMNRSLEVGALYSFIAYTNQILYQISLISMMLLPVIGSLVSVGRVLAVLEKEPSVKDEHAESSLEVKDGSLSFEHVWFDYNSVQEQKDMLLQDINFSLKDREAIGIVGATGAGKTTLVNLIPKLYVASEGKILLGGAEISELSLDHLRKSIAFVPQKSVLFSGSLRENLRCGKSDATEEEMKKALEDACIYDEVMSHPEGLDMPLDEGGNNVSGGQRQRLCLARGFIRQSKLLIMDDCTSALDKATERAVIDHILHRYSDRTRILISGKISSIRQMDRIIVMDKGKISAIGTHDELVQSSAIYRDLCQSQGEL